MSNAIIEKIEQLRADSVGVRTELEAVLRRTYYAGVDDAVFAQPEVSNDVHDHVYKRYERILCSYMPWITDVYDLAGKDVVEIGCGTGSSTAAFAPFCRHVHAYEIEGQSIEAARARIDLLGITNASLVELPAEKLLDEVKAVHVGGVSVVLLFAVLEHMTVQERLTSLKMCWDLLSPDGILVVAETPNRLTYYDFHTARLPFFHMLPLELAIRYYERSPRVDFRRQMSAYIASRGVDGAVDALARWGNGVSYHEFELALGSDLGRLLIGDGDGAEMRKLYPVSAEERILRDYFIQANVDRPVAFANSIFNLIFQKKGV